jgi:hypothetical protein
MIGKQVLSGVVVLLFTFQHALSEDILRIPFECVDNRIIIKIETNKGEILNFLFDTGSSGLMLDYTVAKKYSLLDDTSHLIHRTLITTGRVNEIILNKRPLFTDTLISAICTPGVAIDMDDIPNKPPVKISGIIGVNVFARTYGLVLDFENHFLTIAKNLKPDLMHLAAFSVRIIYTDDGFESSETDKIRNVNWLMAGKTVLYLGGNRKMEVNGIFDTGCRFGFYLLASAKDETFVRELKGDANNSIESDTTSSGIIRRYSLVTDSVVVGTVRVGKGERCFLSFLPASNLAFYGNTNAGMLIGVAFMKRFRRVYFDYPGKRIYFIN